MQYKQLGRSGLFVSEICLGTMTFGGTDERWQAMGGLALPEVEAIVSRALAAGVNFIDTADVYSGGRSEKLLGQALRNLGLPRKDVVLATKVYGEVGPGPNDRGASRGHIMDSIQGSLERLQTDHIDLYQIHAHDALTPLDETLRALDDLISQRLVRYIGISNWSAWKIAQALGLSERKNFARFDTLQAYYSIAGRDLERELVPLLQEEKLGLMVWSPLAGGFLSGKVTRDSNPPQGSRWASMEFIPVNRERAFDCIDAMREVGNAHGVSVARVALAYVLAKPFVTSVIIGARTMGQLEDNLAATELRLTESELAKLDEVSALSREYPGWMIEFQGGRRLPPKAA